MAAVDPDGFPSHVAPDELIESAWGNATVDNLHRIDQKVDTNWQGDVDRDNAQNARMDAIDVRNNAQDTFMHQLGWQAHAWAATYQAGISTAYVALTGMRADWVARNGHSYLITCHVEFYKAGSDISHDIELVVSLGSSGTNVGRARGFCEQGYSLTVQTAALVVSGPDHADFVQAFATTGAGFANARNDRLILVQDLGQQ